MKKIVALALFTVGSFTGMAQHEIGAKAGYTYLMGKYETSLSDVNVTLDGGGYQFGGYYTYSPMENMFLSGELLFSGRMWNEAIVGGSDGAEVTTLSESLRHYSNTYLEIPLSIKYGINMRRTRYGANKYLLFYAGPSAHLLMGSRGSSQETFRVDAQGQTTVVQDESDFTKAELRDYFTPVQVGLHGGIQFTFEFGLNIDLRYQQLLMPVSVDTEAYGALKQGMATFTVGYSFFRE
jgi:hypothetical protein